MSKKNGKLSTLWKEFSEFAIKGNAMALAVGTIIGAAFKTITDSLTKGEKVQIAGFGTFEVKARGERVGRNPATKEQIVIPASKHPAFSAGKALKEKVNH